MQRCSNGVDRRRQEWTNHGKTTKQNHIFLQQKSLKFMFIILGCDKSQLTDSKLCPVVHVPEPQIHVPVHHSKTLSIVGIACILIILLVGWIFYAYTHPLSGSGQLLIQYGRPAAWAFRRGEARYTAATIHM